MILGNEPNYNIVVASSSGYFYKAVVFGDKAVTVAEAASNSGTCVTSEPIKNKENKSKFGTFGTMWHFGSLIKNPGCNLPCVYQDWDGDCGRKEENGC